MEPLIEFISEYGVLGAVLLLALGAVLAVLKLLDLVKRGGNGRDSHDERRNGMVEVKTTLARIEQVTKRMEEHMGLEVEHARSFALVQHQAGENKDKLKEFSGRIDTLEQSHAVIVQRLGSIEEGQKDILGHVMSLKGR